MRTTLLLAALAAFAIAAPAVPQPSSPAPQAPMTSPADEDPFLWLEDVHGDRAMAWVRAENTRTLGVLEADRRYAGFLAEALKIVNATDRIAAPTFIGAGVYNFWQDPTNVRGLWRRTTPASYNSGAPQWETVLDLDTLSKSENANWVWSGAYCPSPTFDRCLISLSDGGEDATVVREFDLPTRTFVTGGFNFPKGKQDISMLDRDTALVAREWEPGTMTESGYAFVVKSLRRGQPLSAAVEIYRGLVTDVGVSPLVMHDADGHTVALIVRNIDFYNSEVRLITPEGLKKLLLPAKSTIQGFVDNTLIFTIQEDWTFNGKTYKSGSLLGVLPEELVPLGPNEVRVSNGNPLIYEPGPRESIEQVAITAHRVVAAVYDNVRGRIYAFENKGERGWPKTVVPVADNSSTGIAAASDIDDSIYFSVEGFLDPPRLYAANAGAQSKVTAQLIKTLPARFNAATHVVEQFEATSSDGTKVPYFVVRPRNMPFDGSTPTILYAYGGFQSSELPSYSGSVGKLWLEQGGVWVIANIRGGGEFGPAWHQAGLKTHRQLIYDDFAAVARDLIARKITSPRRLGIEGGSNGGLLMGVEFNQHPELWRAVVIQVPLLDMLRFDKIGAGASWVGEYGSPSDPVEGAFLRSISPYHNLRAGVAYPEPFFVTATSDDRVTPVHARKMAARMAAMGLPYLFYENTDGGHAASANLQERARRVSLEFTYFTRKLVD